MHYSTRQCDTFKWLLLVHHQLSLLKCEPSQEHVIITSVNKCRTRIILTVGHALFPNHLILSASS